MPKILITGNGFDLNLGLPTSYCDFIKILDFIEGNGNPDFESVYSHSISYLQIKQTFKPFTFDKSKLEILLKEIGKNLWFRFFKSEYEIETWIDFENKIDYVLKKLFASVVCIQATLSKGKISNESTGFDGSIFNDDVEIIAVLRSFNIISLNRHSEIVLNSDFLLKKYGYYIDINFDKITAYLYQALSDFKRIFNYYFEIFVFPFYNNLKVKLDKGLFEGIHQHFTFNYTPTFEMLYGRGKKTKFLHGKVSSEENKIVLGINEIPESENLNKKFFLPFTKYFQKLNYNTDYVFVKEFHNKLNDNYYFFFFGHSLDKSDEDYINEVFDFVVDLKVKIKKIIIIYHNEGSKSNLLINLLNIRGKKDIQDLMRGGILVFHHIQSPELKQDFTRGIANVYAQQLVSLR